MDKSWIHADRMSKDYKEGVEVFIKGCLESVGSDPEFIPCPCYKCINMKMGPVKMIREHLFFNGFDKFYSNWNWHGESTGKHEEAFGDYDNSEVGNMCEATYENYTEDPSMFMKFLEVAEKPLYKGCQRYTKLSPLVRLYNLKAKHGMTSALFSNLLVDFGEMLPDNHQLPSSMYEAKKTLSYLGLKHEKIHACSNNCVLYMERYKYYTSCPKCNLSRWKLSKMKVEKVGVPAKVVWYLEDLIDISSSLNKRCKLEELCLL